MYFGDSRQISSPTKAMFLKVFSRASYQCLHRSSQGGAEQLQNRPEAGFPRPGMLLLRVLPGPAPRGGICAERPALPLSIPPRQLLTRIGLDLAFLGQGKALGFLEMTR